MFLKLPPEIIVQVLQELEIVDLFSCQVTSKYLDNLIRESVVLQYHAALVATKTQDNPCSPLTIAEKLRSLKSSEESWAFLRSNFTASIPVTHNQSGVYDLSSGVYLLSNLTKTAVHYLKLPRKEGDEAAWKVLKSKKTIIDIGLCIHEHDLIVNVAAEPRINIGVPTTFDIELQLLEFSTGNPHPHAREPRIFVMNTEQEKPSIGIEIVGDNLVLILSHTSGWRPDNRIFVFEWKTGVLKISFEAAYQSYSGLIFLSEDLILLPNTRTNGLDIFRIPAKPTLVSPRPILTLNLPGLSHGRLLGGVSCRSEPNPISPASIPIMKQRAQDLAAAATHQLGGKPSPVRPFLASAEDALCIFDLRLLVPQLVMDAGGALNMHFQFRHRLTFVVHRNALVNLVDIYAREEQESDIVEIAQVDPPHAAVVDMLTEGAPGAIPGGVDAEEEDLGPDVENLRSRNMVPWAQWGPAITRWFNSDNVSTHWITTTVGQRCVRMASDPPDDGYHFVVLDFNPVNVKKMQLWLKEQAEGAEAEKKWQEKVSGFGFAAEQGSISNVVAAGVHDSPEAATAHMSQLFAEDDADAMSGFHVELGSDDDSTGSPTIADDELEMINQDEFLYFPTSNRVQVITRPEQIEPADAFSEPVVGGLPYVIYASQDRHVYDGVLLDEEWVIGVMTGETENIDRIEVHHFG